MSAMAAFAQDKPAAIGWANLQWPPSTNHVLSATNRTASIYGQIWIDGVTSKPGATPDLRAQLGFGPSGSNPRTSTNWVWLDASFNVDVGNNDEFMAAPLPESAGNYDYVYRYSAAPNGEWLYADLKGPVPANEAPANPGKLSVAPSGDKMPPAGPTRLVVAGLSTNSAILAWPPVEGDPTLFGYELRRSLNAGGPYTNLARITNNTFTDANLLEGSTYYYVVRSVDLSFNRSSSSAEVSVTPEPAVSVVLSVVVPPGNEGKTVYLAGTLAGLNGGLLDWDPGFLPLTRVDATHWGITLRGKEGTQLNYKYTLGVWENVEKGMNCDEISDRQLTLTPLTSGKAGALSVTDTVLRWRNIAPCAD